jgi:hypothetical protein
LGDKTYFSKLSYHDTPIAIKTLHSTAPLGLASGTAQISLPCGIVLTIPHAIYVTGANRNLLSFQAFHDNGLHLSTGTDSQGRECIHVLQHNHIVDTFLASSTWLCFWNPQNTL